MPVVEIISNDIITGAKMVTRDGFQCICISFQKNENRYLNLNVFSDNPKSIKSILKVYQTTIGKAVKVTCWDPQNSPGKWSQRGWFKNIWIHSDNEKVNDHINQKGFCSICGVADGLLNYATANNDDWYHYRCKMQDWIKHGAQISKD